MNRGLCREDRSACWYVTELAVAGGMTMRHFACPACGLIAVVFTEAEFVFAGRFKMDGPREQTSAGQPVDVSSNGLVPLKRRTVLLICCCASLNMPPAKVERMRASSCAMPTVWSRGRRSVVQVLSAGSDRITIKRKADFDFRFG